MDQDNERMTENPVSQPVESDLFTMTEKTAEEVPASVETEPPAESPVSETAVKEPEFKVNTEFVPSVRMLNSENSSGQPAESAEMKPPQTKTVLRSNAGASLGAMLFEARTSTGLAIQDVASATHIKTDFIEALEQDKTDALPQPVFLRAYVHAMIRLYNLDAASTNLIEEQLESIQPAQEVPEQLLEDIGRNVQISEAETRKIKLILIYAAIILLLLISLTVTSIAAVRIRNSRRQAQLQQQEVRPFDSTQIETLLPPQLPKPQMLSIPSPAETRKNP